MEYVRRQSKNKSKQIPPKKIKRKAKKRQPRRVEEIYPGATVVVESLLCLPTESWTTEELA